MAIMVKKGNDTANLSLSTVDPFSSTEKVKYMVREYLNQNVYEAFLERMHFLFKEFDNIYLSFSGGKDSGLLLNLVLD